MGILDIFGIHTVTIYEMEQGPYGPVKGPGRKIAGCWAVETPRLVRDTTGAEVVSTAQVAAPTGTTVDLDSEPVVLLPSGRESRILSVSQVDGAAAIGLPDHVELNLE